MSTATSDKRIGLSVVLGVLALASAGVTLALPGTVAGAYGFGAAMAFAALLVCCLHVYSE